MQLRIQVKSHTILEKSCSRPRIWNGIPFYVLFRVMIMHYVRENQTYPSIYRRVREILISPNS